MLPPQKPNPLLCLGLLFLAELGSLLGLVSLCLSLAGGLGLRTLGVHLLLEESFTCLLGLSSVNVLDQCTLVLEGVTLAQVVKFVVKVFVDLTAGTVLDQETSEDSKTAHPNNLAWHTGICGTLSLTETTVSTNSSCSGELTSACAGVHGDWFADDESIGNELADGLTGVGVGDFAGLVGVEPDLALSAADDGSRQALLGCEIDHLD